MNDPTQNDRPVPPLPSVLVIDDDPDIVLLVRVLLEAADLSVVGEAYDGVQGLSLWRTLRAAQAPDVVVLDNQMPGPAGLEIAARMLEEHPEQAIVLCTSFFDPGIQTAALELGITECVPKDDLLHLPDLVHQLVLKREGGGG